MKRSFTFLCGVVLLGSMLCASQELVQNNTNPNDIEEAHKLKILLDATRPVTTMKPISTSSTSQPDSHSTSGTKEEPDYSFQNDRLPLLSDDEFNNLTDDANPLYFLKQLTEPTKPQTKPDSVPGSPIYITIPIYINTAGKIPLSLTIGDQEMTLEHQQRLNSANKRKDSTKIPNSHFNRLLEINEPSKRRTTNRHRSPIRSKIQALKEPNTAERSKDQNRKKTN
ncbi:uncharacterized protein LOC117787067 [Drosophila innubila]|uniref:uncharacterized protein LOC117787067 n=1 Tax=Drosophila innubila TaxID=198719 RepID=UPI00148E0BE8|nr:uncharacterized protein LOC117787067 [Drosophila innubila]